MSGEVTAAIITAVGTVAGAVVGALLGARRGRKAERLAIEKQSQASAKSLQEHLADRFGLTAASVTSHMVVTSSTGDATVRRCWRGIRAAEGHVVPYVSGKFFTATRGGRISTPPRLSNVDQYPKEVTLRLLQSTDSDCRYRIDVAGFLTDADPPLDFDVAIDYLRTVLMTKEEVQQAYANDVFKHDYFCFDVEWPLRTLELEVTFPTELAVTVFPTVFFGWSEFEHHAELQRAKDGFVRTPYGARLMVAEPLVGFRYALYWVFPGRTGTVAGTGTP